ncbi:MAG: hypothetical protein M3139_10010 [Bacteroidota bacterium]|nr:hypothetical protein [Bacteroidota bacterium]
METIVIQSKDKSTSKYIKKMLKELDGIERISVLSASDREDLAMINAINKGRSGDYIDTEVFLKKIKGK